MPFYKLEHATTTSEIGVYPQARLAKLSHEPDENYILNVAVPLEGKILKEIAPAQLRLEKGAKMVDLLAIAALGNKYKIVSHRLFNLLQTFELDEWQTSQASLEHKGLSHPYHLIHLVWSRNRDYVDWEKTIFGHTTNMWRELIAELQFQDYDAFTSFHRTVLGNNEHLIVRKLVLREDVIDKDMFRLLFVSTGFYVSQRLKDALQAENISGCKFTPVADLGDLVLREKNPHMFNDSK